MSEVTDNVSRIYIPIDYTSLYIPQLLTEQLDINVEYLLWSESSLHLAVFCWTFIGSFLVVWENCLIIYDESQRAWSLARYPWLVLPVLRCAITTLNSYRWLWMNHTEFSYSAMIVSWLDMIWYLTSLSSFVIQWFSVESVTFFPSLVEYLGSSE